MRSPWLSREYEKSDDVVIAKVKNKYELKNKITNASLLLTKSEYNKYESNSFNEIEWERLFFKGLAVGPLIAAGFTYFVRAVIEHFK